MINHQFLGKIMLNHQFSIKFLVLFLMFFPLKKVQTQLQLPALRGRHEASHPGGRGQKEPRLPGTATPAPIGQADRAWVFRFGNLRVDQWNKTLPK